MAVVAMGSGMKYPIAHTVDFDTDARAIGADNGYTAYISDIIIDFVGELRDCNKSMKGYGGTRTGNLKIGTLRWKWADDKGHVSKFLILKSYYSKDGGGGGLDY